MFKPALSSPVVRISWMSVTVLLPYGVLANGAIVVLAKSEMGRAQALRMPIVIVVARPFAVFVYGRSGLKID